jgi:hypothetical protein
MKLVVPLLKLLNLKISFRETAIREAEILRKPLLYLVIIIIVLVLQSAHGIIVLVLQSTHGIIVLVLESTHGIIVIFQIRSKPGN